MKKFLLFLIAVSVLSIIAGCANGAKPVVIDNGTQSRMLVPCTNDNLCVRSGYEVAKDAWCTSSCAVGERCCAQDYPVSYRSKSWEYESNRVEYIDNTRQQAGK